MTNSRCRRTSAQCPGSGATCVVFSGSGGSVVTAGPIVPCVEVLVVDADVEVCAMQSLMNFAFAPLRGAAGSFRTYASHFASHDCIAFEAAKAPDPNNGNANARVVAAVAPSTEQNVRRPVQQKLRQLRQQKERKNKALNHEKIET